MCTYEINSEIPAQLKRTHHAMRMLRRARDQTKRTRGDAAHQTPTDSIDLIMMGTCARREMRAPPTSRWGVRRACAIITHVSGHRHSFYGVHMGYTHTDTERHTRTRDTAYTLVATRLRADTPHTYM